MVTKELTNYGFKNQIISTGNTKKQLLQNLRKIQELEAIGVEFNFTVSRFQNN